jgi:superfamily II DNA/RNA helicase
MPTYYSSRSQRGSYKKSYSSQRSIKKKGQKQFIHPSKFVQAAKPVTEEVFTPKHSFADFMVNDILKANIAAKGFVSPSPIQDQAIPLALEGADIIGIANTGTGKTAAFGIPVLHLLMNNSNARALILAPTRELAEQIDADFASLAKGSGLNAALLIGGMNIAPQIRELRANPQVVIGTPGRIKDHLERGTLQLHDVNMVVLDEVDRMLDMGFINDIRSILQLLPAERQSLFFSATLDGKVREIISQFTNDPVTISVKTTSSSENVHQDIIPYMTREDQITMLHNTLIKDEVEKAIIFDETQRSVERLSKELLSRGFSADAIHGGKSQGQRKRALDKFKKNQINILVATDVAARGIDVSDITHVINYTVPQTYDDYVHRVGRAGRAGRVGYAYTFVSAHNAR